MLRKTIALVLLILSSLACSTSSMVQTATPIPTASASPTSALVITPFLSTPSDFGTVVFDDQRTVCADALNVRSGPSLESVAVAWLRRGHVVTVLESRDGWARLADGWVKGVYLNSGECAK